MIKRIRHLLPLPARLSRGIRHQSRGLYCLRTFVTGLITFSILLFFVVVFFLAPSRAPDLVTTHNSSSTSLVVKWSHLPEEHFQGQPIGYNINYYPFDFESDVNFVSVNYTTNTTTLTDLTVYTMYFINVSAVSTGGIGPANTATDRTDATGTKVFKIAFTFGYFQYPK